MNPNRRLLSTLLMLLVVVLALSPVVSAKDSDKPIKLKRDAKELGQAAPSTSFGEVPSTTDEVCSGSCDCSTCECTGTLSCCVGGCEACWEYRDSRGFCNAV